MLSCVFAIDEVQNGMSELVPRMQFLFQRMPFQFNHSHEMILKYTNLVCNRCKELSHHCSQLCLTQAVT
jgi:hypothetical protein